MDSKYILRSLEYYLCQILGLIKQEDTIILTNLTDFC